MKKDIKNNIIKPLVGTVVFLLILGLMLSVCSRFLIPKENTPQAGVKNYISNAFHYENDNTVDTVFLGNSELYRSVSPMELYIKYGYAAYDIGIHSARMGDLYYILDDFLQHQSPQLLVLDVDSVFINAPTQTQYDLSAKSVAKFWGEDSDSIDDAVSRFADEIFPSIEYHSRWKSLTRADFTDLPDYSKFYDYKGYANDDAVKPYTGDDFMKDTDQIDYIHTGQRFFLDKIISRAKDSNIDVLLVEGPEAKMWNMQRHNAISQYAEENGLTFIDCNVNNDEVGIDWSKDSKDGGEHLNVSGAQKVSAYYGKYLDANYDLPDRRGDTTYQSWENEVTKYNDMVKTSLANIEKNAAAVATKEQKK